MDRISEYSHKTAFNAKHDVALTGRNRTGPPCSVGPAAADCPRARRQARPPAGSVSDDDRRRQMTDVNVQNNTGPLGSTINTF